MTEEQVAASTEGDRIIPLWRTLYEKLVAHNTARASRCE